ncbi:MAG TPA: hypothetical protein PLR99_28170 [Polyangiaceae bacterium]|nr:hypothetical protein [Polyangiaceae bacterium]
MAGPGRGLRRALAELETESFAEACPLFLRAYEESPAPTTLALAADCLDRGGRLASAHATYTRLLALEGAALPEAARARALARVAELGPRRSRLTVRLPPDLRARAGLVVWLDGAPVPRDAWDAPHPRDGGPVTVRVAAGDLAFTTTVALAAEGDDRVVDVPGPAGLTSGRVARVELSPRGGARAPTAGYLLDEGDLGPAKLTGAALVAGGGLAAITGVVLGVLAKADHNRAATLCDANRCADRALVDAADDARTKGDVGTAVGLAGLGLMAGGAALFWLTPARTPESGATLSVAPRGLGLVARGSFQ